MPLRSIPVSAEMTKTNTKNPVTINLSFLVKLIVDLYMYTILIFEVFA